MVDMTGGIGEGFELQDFLKAEEDKRKLFRILRKSKERHSLISASIKVISRLSSQPHVKYELRYAKRALSLAVM